jgi:hypothetical protein
MTTSEQAWEEYRNSIRDEDEDADDTIEEFDKKGDR